MSGALLGHAARISRSFMDPRDAAISVQNLGKRYWLKQSAPTTFQQTLMAMARGVKSTPFWALRDVSFQVRPGESLGIIGANGAGKSTLLRLMCGLGRPTTGAVQIQGRVAALLQVGAGFHQHLTGRENLYVSAIMAGLRRREVRALFDTIVEFAELGDFIDQPLRTYSTGMQMRLGFAVAIHVDPAVMMIDEGLSVGDAHFQQKCLDRIKTFRTRGKTLVMVSHEMGMIRSFCTTAVWLRRGALVGEGPIETILPQFEAVIERESLSGSRDDRVTSGS